MAGALRREQAAETLFKRSAVEIDHLKRLVGTVPIYSAPWFQITVLVAMIVMPNLKPLFALSSWDLLVGTNWTTVQHQCSLLLLTVSLQTVSILHVIELFFQVKQRDDETHHSKAILKFREDKIRRLEALSEGMVTTDTCLVEEKNAALQELELVRSQQPCNPELTKYAMEQCGRYLT